MNSSRLSPYCVVIATLGMYVLPSVHAQKTDFDGQILTSEWLALGPIANANACAGDGMLGNHIAPSFIGCEYPTLDDEPLEGIDFSDPQNAALELNPTVEAVWRQFDDTTPDDGDLNFDLDVAGDLSQHMIWVATWVEYAGEDPTSIELCVGSDDSVQIWLNGRLVHQNASCRGRAVCQDRVLIEDLEPGIYCIRMGVWENDGGWGGSLALNYGDTGLPILDGEDDEWVFHGVERPEAFVAPECAPVCGPVGLVCSRDEDGTIDLEWTNPDGCVSEISVYVGEELIATLEPVATSYTIAPEDAPFALSVSIDNGSVARASCLLAEVLGVGTEALLGNVDGEGDLTDLENDGDEFLYLGPDDLGEFDAIFFSSDEEGFEGGEFAFNVFDNVLGPGNAKWCCGTVFPQIVGADFDGIEYRLTHFTVSSANDVPDRDPRAWSIEGSLDGEDWETIFSHSNPASALWTERFQVLLFREGRDYPVQTDAYSMFRMVTEQTNLTSGAFFQVGEIEFFGEEGPLVTGGSQLPADMDQSGVLDTTDAIVLLGHLFLGSPTALGCPAGADHNGDGNADTSDAIALLVQLFAGGAPPVLGTSCVNLDGCPNACQ